MCKLSICFQCCLKNLKIYVLSHKHFHYLMKIRLVESCRKLRPWETSLWMTCTISTQSSLQTVFACLKICLHARSEKHQHWLWVIILNTAWHTLPWGYLISNYNVWCTILNPVKQGRIWIDVLHTQLHNHQIFWKTDTDPSFQRLGKSMPGYIEAVLRESGRPMLQLKVSSQGHSNLSVHHVVMLQSVAACSCYTCAKQKWKIKSTVSHFLNIC